jgi:hypothetical protein
MVEEDKNVSRLDNIPPAFKRIQTHLRYPPQFNASSGGQACINFSDLSTLSTLQTFQPKPTAAAATSSE